MKNKLDKTHNPIYAFVTLNLLHSPFMLDLFMIPITFYSLLIKPLSVGCRCGVPREQYNLWFRNHDCIWILKKSRGANCMIKVRVQSSSALESSTLNPIRTSGGI